MADLDYLLSDALRSRQCIAAFALRFCRRILEIGGGANPISYHVTMPLQSVTVVDPKVSAFRAVRWNGHICRVRHLAMRIEDFDPEEHADGLCMLGFLGWGHLGRDCIMRHVNAANIVVIEAARNHEPAQAAIQDVIATSGKKISAHITLDCRGDGIPANHRFALRELYILKG